MHSTTGLPAQEKFRGNFIPAAPDDSQPVC